MRRGESISADRILPSRAGVKRRKWSEAARDTASVMQLVCLSVCLFLAVDASVPVSGSVRIRVSVVMDGTIQSTRDTLLISDWLTLGRLVLDVRKMANSTAKLNRAKVGGMWTRIRYTSRTPTDILCTSIRDSRILLNDRTGSKP